MKVYGCPAEVPAPKVDYFHFDIKKVDADENAHKAALKAWLIKAGYTGKDTGKVASFGVADGGAQYLFGDKGAKSILIHLPYGDAYQYPDVRFLPVAEVRRRLNQAEKFAALFAKG